MLKAYTKGIPCGLKDNEHYDLTVFTSACSKFSFSSFLF